MIIRFVLMSLLWFVSARTVMAQVKQDSVQTGTASYYANKFQGRKTSSGQVFDQNKFTAAHKHLPFGTRVKVINLSNDSTVVVVVNDRLPKSSKRSIDLTLAAARQLNFVKKGLTKVRMELLPPNREEKPAGTE
jgi:rare lipoprotein A